MPEAGNYKNLFKFRAMTFSCRRFNASPYRSLGGHSGQAEAETCDQIESVTRGLTLEMLDPDIICSPVHTIQWSVRHFGFDLGVPGRKDVLHSTGGPGAGQNLYMGCNVNEH
jgi:hypothetical protein